MAVAPDPTDELLAEPGRTSTVSALASPQFRLLWAGLAISNIGMWMQLFGQGYLVVQLAIRDGAPQLAPLYLGLVGLSRAIPGLTLSLFGGAVADRYDRRRLLLATQVAASAVAGILAALTITDRIGIAEVIVLATASSVVHAFEAPTRQSMIPGLVPERDLSSAVGLSAAAFNAAQLIGPLLGGLLYVPLGIGGLFALNALSYFAVVVAVARMRPVRRPPVQAGSVVRSIGEGLAFIRGEPVIRWSITIAAGVAVLARPYPQLLPAIVEQVLELGAIELSWLMGASGAGALVGSLTVATLGNVRRRGVILIVSASALGLALALFSLQRSLVGALPLMALIGFAAILTMGTSSTILQLRTPNELRGRVMSVHVTLMLGTVPLGVMLLGSLGTVVGVDVSVMLGAILVTLIALFAATRRDGLRGLTDLPSARLASTPLPRPAGADARP